VLRQSLSLRIFAYTILVLVVCSIAQAQSPQISNLTPVSGVASAQVTISGTNFGTTQGSSTVTFNGTTAATITNWDATSITATVPTGATSGNVVVTVGGVASNGVWFTFNDTYGNGYQYRQALVLGHANVPNTDQTDFPVLISGVYSYLANVSNGGLVQNTNGYDIIFSQDPEGATQLDYEIDGYDPTTGTVAFWVRIPTLSHTVDTVIYMFYGNANIASSQQNLAGVWRNNYLSVYHLGNGSSVGLSDSGSAGYTLGGSAAAVSGKIGGGAAFNGNAGVYLYNDSLPAYPSGDSPVTLETWVQLAGSGDAGEILGYGANSQNGSRDALYWDGANLQMEMENMEVYGPFPFDNNWHHLVSVYGGGALSTTTDQLYLDGAPLSTNTSGGTPAITTTEFKIGGIPTVNFCCALNGSVDEVRVSAGVRSSDWVATEYANESSPSAFYTVEGQATPNSAPTIQLLSPNAYPIGVPIVIQGYGFQPTQGASTVAFDGVTATPTSWNDASIIVPVPAGAATGNVIVTVGSVASNGAMFTVISGPTITNLSAYSGPVGTSITITGNNFGAAQGTSTVTFNGTAATPTTWSAGSIVVPVPTGATAGNIVVVVSGVPSPGVAFTVIATPIVSSLSPAAGPVGTQVTIQGSNFGSTQGSSTLTFNGASPASITSWADGQIVAVVSSMITTGPVTVVVNSVPSNSNVVFTAYNPNITSLSPPSGSIGSSIIVNGDGFGASQGSSTVNFNGSPTNVDSWSDSAIEVQVPGTVSCPVTVTMNGVTSNAVEFTVEGPPTISTLSATNGAPGTAITITGSGFGSTQSDSTVAFYGSTAAVSSWSDSEIVAIVPAAASGPVTVTVAATPAQGPNFTVDTVATLTNSNGYQTIYTSAMIGGVWMMLSAQGPGCSSCSIRNNEQDTYDSNGNMLTRTDANGNTVTYTYDTNNNVLSKSAQLNGSAVTTSYTYNSFGEVLTMTDPLGNTTTNTYDANGNLLTVTTPAPNGQTSASVMQFAYNNLGELTQITDPLSHITALSYNATGLIQSITDAQNNTTSYTYDARGNRTSVVDPINGSGHPTTFTYDLLNHLLGITYPNGASVSFTYDYRGRRVSATDQNNKTTYYAYDDADRLLSVTDPAGNVTQYTYDTENNLLSITDANNHTTSFTYDPFGRVIQTTFPSTLVETYGYDPVGNLTSKTDRKGQTIQCVYDALYRMTSKTYPDSSSANYVYDLVGKIQQVSDPTGTYGFAYDNMGRLIGTATQYSFLPGYSFQNSYTYDASSNRTSFTAPDGSTNTYSYDTLNRLNTLTSSLTGQFGFAYDALSRRTQLTRPNGIDTNYGYDAASNLLSILHQAGSTTLDGASYGNAAAGNRTSKTNYLNETTSTYGYDAIYELLSATGGTSENYTYDVVGNRLSSAGISQYSYNASNELVSNSNGSYTYDANGNTLTDASGKSYTWDFENRMVSAVVPGTGTVTFKYDPFGRRIYKSSPNFTGIFAYDGFNLIMTMNSGGTVVSRYTLTQNIDEPLAEFRSGGNSYYEADGLGSITSLSSSAGALANTYTYDSFGNVTSSTGTLSNPFRYTGREFDSETGLDFNRARYYDSTAGRFLSEDPIRFFGGVDFYSYVSNSSTNFSDPLGLCPAANNGTPQQPQNQQPSRLKDCAKAYYGFNTASGAAQDATRIALIPAAPIIPKAAVGLPQALGSGPLTNLLSYFSLGSGTAASGANIFRVAGRIGAPIAIASAVIDATAIGICASDYQGWLPHF
jgi:RHS repeat-associated protein